MHRYNKYVTSMFILKQVLIIFYCKISLKIISNSSVCRLNRSKAKMLHASLFVISIVSCTT